MDIFENKEFFSQKIFILVGENKENVVANM